MRTIRVGSKKVTLLPEPSRAALIAQRTLRLTLAVMLIPVGGVLGFCMGFFGLYAVSWLLTVITGENYIAIMYLSIPVCILTVCAGCRTGARIGYRFPDFFTSIRDVVRSESNPHV